MVSLSKFVTQFLTTSILFVIEENNSGTKSIYFDIAL